LSAISLSSLVVFLSLGLLACDEPGATGLDTMPAPASPPTEAAPAPTPASASACPTTGDGVAVTDTSLVAQGPIGFDLYAPSVTPESSAALDAVARRLAACPDVAVEVQVHTDTRRMESFNARQSQSVAELVKAHLLAAGVDAERIAACGYGESQPMVGVEPWDPVNDRVLFVRLASAASAHACPTSP
jgi:outer membrane protein OmpA-like peptidoglycan-associated protein